MLKRIKVYNYKLLRDVQQDLDGFNIVIGPNASGKSTLLDALAFVRDFVNHGLQEAVLTRAGSFSELTFQHRGGVIEFEIDIWLEDDARRLTGAEFARYRLAFQAENDTEFEVADESLWLHYPQQDNASICICQRTSPEKLNERIPEESARQTDQDKPSSPRFESGYYAELYAERMDFDPLGEARTEIVAKLQEDDQSILLTFFDPQRNPAGIFVRDVLLNAICPIRLDPAKMAKPQQVAPGRFKGLSPDGANIAAAIKHVQEKHSERFKQWLFHVRNVLLDIEHIYPFEQGDRSLGFEVRYRGFPKDEFVRADSLSDGTLRFLALTLLAFLPADGRTYLVEEPENGIHPPAIESVYKRLSSVVDGQVIVATHSPLFLLWAELRTLLLLSRIQETGEARITRSTEHPLLLAMQSPLDLPALFESGILSEVLG